MDKYYSFSRSGERSTEYLLSKSDMESKEAWDGWTKKYGKKFAEFEGTKYVYEYSAFPKYIWNDECSLYIQNEQNSIELLYQDEWIGKSNTQIAWFRAITQKDLGQAKP